ncbi:MAG: hypothetical protein JNL74_16405 [Fibrobacteres bacterium]|nr:hypothetical protein [Fibrobacterota bacterium]
MLMIAVIALLICGGYLIALKVKPTTVPGHFRKAATIIFFVAIGFIVKPFDIVPTGNKGLLFTFGSISNNIKEPGLVFRLPFIQEIKLITLRPIQLDYRVDVGPSGAITKDNQTIGATIVFFYKYNENSLVEMYTKYGEEKIKSIVTKTGLESFKMDIGNYDIFSLPVRQEEIRRNTLAMVREKMASYPVEITELKITNYDWSDEFDRQISETMHRAQQVKQKEQELLITEQEARKKVKTAEADKQALITTAEGEKAAAQLRADAKALEGDGIRKYNEAVQKNMQLEIQIRKLEIEKIKAEKWNGQYVPTNNYGPIPLSTGKIQPE